MRNIIFSEMVLKIFNINDYQKYLPSRVLSLTVFAALLSGPSLVTAAPILGDNLATFAALGATGVTNVPTSTIGGNLGSAPNPSVGGGYIFSSGSLQQNTPLAQNAQLELDAAILAVNAFGPGTNIGSSLDTWQSSQGGVIAPGTYTVTHDLSANVVGDIFLDGLGSNTAVWNFLFTSDLVTSSTSNIFVQNIGDGAEVGLYWSVATSATLNGPTFAGNVLAQTLISSDGNLTMSCGRLLSATAQVTLNQDSISIADCGNASGGFDQGVGIGSGGTGGSNGQVVNGTVPEPSTILLFGFGLVGLSVFRKGAKNA